MGRFQPSVQNAAPLTVLPPSLSRAFVHERECVPAPEPVLRATGGESARISAVDNAQLVTPVDSRQS
jgi:hypothetical protein